MNTTTALRTAAENKRRVTELSRDELVDHNGKKLTTTQILAWWKRNCNGYVPKTDIIEPLDRRTEAQKVAAQLDRAVLMIMKDDPSFRMSTTWAGSIFNTSSSYRPWAYKKRSVNRYSKFY